MADYANSPLAALLRYGHPSESNDDDVFPVRSGPFVPPPRNRAEAAQQLRDARANGQISPSAVAREGDRPPMEQPDYETTVPPGPSDPAQQPGLMSTLVALLRGGGQMPAHVETPVYTAGGQRMMARQPTPEMNRNPADYTRATGMALADPAGIPSMLTGVVSPETRDNWRAGYEGRPEAQMAAGALTPWSTLLKAGGAGINAGGRLVQGAVNAAPRTATGAAAVTGLTAGAEGANPRGRADANAPATDANATRQIVASDPVLQNLERQIAEQDAIANAHPREQVLKNRERASTEASRLREQFNTRLTEMGRASLPFDQAYPWLAQNRAAVAAVAPAAAGWATRGLANKLDQVAMRPWQSLVANAERTMPGAKNPNPAAFEYYAGAAENAAARRGPGRVGDAARAGGSFWRDWGLPAVAGASVGAELGWLPHQHNRYNAPPGSPARKAADDALSADNVMATGLPGALVGGFTGLTGAHVLPNYGPGYRPFAESAQLAKMLRRNGAESGASPSAGPVGPGAPAIAGPAPSSVAQSNGGRLTQNMQAGAPHLQQAQPQLQSPLPAVSPSRSSLASLLRSGSPANANTSTTRGLPPGFREDDRLRGSGVRGPDGRISSRPPPRDDPAD